MSTSPPRASLLSLYRQMLTGKYHTHGKVEQADSIIGVSFGMRCDRAAVCVPDPSNYALAQFIERIQPTPALPEFLQHEVDNHIHGKYEVALDVAYPKRTRKRYLDTYEVLRQIRIQMTKDHCTRPVIVAHAFHVPRVEAVARQMGWQTIVLPGLPRVWDKESSQLWTRNRLWWWLRESIALLVYKLKGFI